MPLKLITLNIEGDKHFDTVLPFLQQQMADVVCLQEVFEADLELITQTLGGTIYFAPIRNMSNKQNNHPPRGLWGLATWIKPDLTSDEPVTEYYNGDAQLAQQDSDPTALPRAVLITTISHDGKHYVIANTHFTWTPDGEASEQQRIDVVKLLQLLSVYPELILCGDFNAPRGKEIFSSFLEKFTDNLPTTMTSTIDPALHRTKGAFDLAVDTIFSTADYVVKNVEVFQGISDHKAIRAFVSVTSPKPLA